MNFEYINLKNETKIESRTKFQLKTFVFCIYKYLGLEKLYQANKTNTLFYIDDDNVLKCNLGYISITYQAVISPN